MNLKLNSEFGRLKAVITHRPGKEIERLTPANTSELLFEDVPYLEGMQREHDEFRALIRDAVGAKVYRLHDLLMETLQKSAVKTALFSRLMESMDSESFVEDFLARYSTAECASILVAGIKVKELRKKMNGSLISAMEKERYIIPSKPQSIFYARSCGGCPGRGYQQPYEVFGSAAGIEPPQSDFSKSSRFQIRICKHLSSAES
jgi:arginine deiminase